MKDKDIIIYFDILEKLYTKAQTDELLEQLSALLENLFDAQISIEKKLSNNLSPLILDKLVQSCIKNNIDYHNEAVLEKYIVDLKNLVKQIPAITVYFAFSPTESNFEELSKYLMSSYKKKYIFKVELKPEILGGAVFVYNGVYKDFSLKSRLVSVCQSFDYEKILASEVHTNPSALNSNN